MGKTLTGKTITLEVEGTDTIGGEGQDPGQGGHPPGPAAPDLRREAAGGRPHTPGLQHPEGVHSAPRAPSAWRVLDSGTFPGWPFSWALSANKRGAFEIN